MKLLLIVTMILTAQWTMAQDLAMKHRALCETSEARNLMAEFGSCDLVVNQLEIGTLTGTCRGILMGSIP